MGRLLAILAVCAPLGSAQAQGTDIRALLQAGYEVKAAYNVASYSENAVLFLQKADSLYVCAIRGQQGGLLAGMDVAQALCEPV